MATFQLRRIGKRLGVVLSPEFVREHRLAEGCPVDMSLSRTQGLRCLYGSLKSMGIQESAVELNRLVNEGESL